MLNLELSEMSEMRVNGVKVNVHTLKSMERNGFEVIGMEEN